MPYIKVDCGELDKATMEVEDYVDILNNKMERIVQEVELLSASWQGADAEQFKQEFEKVIGGQSVHMQMLMALDMYSKYLRVVSNEYKEVKSRAVSRASVLRK